MESKTLAAPPEDFLWVWHYCEYGPGNWSPYIIRKRTDRFIYVDPSPGHNGERTVRLDRAKLETEGSDSSHSYYKTFHTTEDKIAREKADRKASAEARPRMGMRELEVGRKAMELGMTLKFVEVAPGIKVAEGTAIFAHDSREELCNSCGGLGKCGRRKCWGCRGKGTRSAMDNYRENHPHVPGIFHILFAYDLAGIIEKIARDSLKLTDTAYVLVSDLN